jgi:hypothetical protein|tara:strand:+ start:607 stop:741 length:135 start_codon:yes stop_codon:yes gene_type:complete
MFIDAPEYRISRRSGKGLRVICAAAVYRPAAGLSLALVFVADFR